MNKLRISTIIEFYVKRDNEPHYKVFEDWSIAVDFYREQQRVADAKKLPEPVLWDRRAQAVFERA